MALAIITDCDTGGVRNVGNKAIRYKPNHYESWYTKGNALLNLQQYPEAIASYDKAIEYKTDYQQAIEARTKAQIQISPQLLNS